MARSIKEILEELFKGKDSALGKYAKVRFVQYEIGLWHGRGVPLEVINNQAKLYFSKRFLRGVSIRTASPERIEKGLDELNHAVKDGCHGRCKRLIEELNEALKAKGLAEITQPEKFLDWLTFDYHVNRDYDGEIVKEPEYGFEIRIFHDADNRNEFWFEVQVLLKSGKIMSMQDICQIVLYKRKHSKSLEGAN